MKTKYIFIIFLTCMLAGGCIDVLDKKDLSALPESEVWNTPLLADSYVNKLYADILPRWDNDVSDKSDESYRPTNYDGSANYRIMYGQLTNNDIDDLPYAQVRNLNLFLANIEKSSIDPAIRSSLTAQVLVLRAWIYFRMVRLYGGVPLILQPQDLKDDLYVTRSKTSTCIAQIIKDLDDAIALNLPWTWTGNDAGRITRAAALALKARILLYYASPQFNVPGTRDANRWAEAYRVNKQAVDELTANGYGLYNNFTNFWFNEMNREAVFVRRYNYPESTNNWSGGSRPREAGEPGHNNQPTVEMVEAFPMKDGVPITESASYDPVLYWKNRDPRFVATIAYNSCIWPLIGRIGDREWTYRGYLPEQNGGTYTGYYCRKAVDLTQTIFDSGQSGTDWVEIRFAEVMLNFAECAAETGKNDEAIQVLKDIRARAGIEPGTNGMYGLKTGLTGTNLMKAVMLERQLELAFEGKRYWDLRRRRMFDTDLNGTRRHGRFANLRPPLTTVEFDNIRNTDIDFETEYSTYFIDETILVDTQFDINFRENYYFYGIPNKHLETNSKLQQTQGWPDNGSGLFNPYD